MSITQYTQRTQLIQDNLYLEAKKMDRTFLVIFLMNWALVTFITSITYDTYMFGAIGGAILSGVASLIYYYFKGSTISRVSIGILIMGFPIIMIQQQLGRIEMHFYVFIVLAFLALYKDVLPLIAASLTASFHHLLFTYLQEIGTMKVVIYSYGCGWDIAILHIIFVLFETVTLAYMIHIIKFQYMNLIAAMDDTEKTTKLLEEARVSRAIAEEATREAQQKQELLESANIELEEQRQQLEEQTRTLELNQQELEIHNSELAQTRQEVERRSQELEDSNRYKSEFLANMSHELRTPLNSINILSKILGDNKDQNLTPKQSEQALTIYRSGKDLLQLINDILDLSKIEARMMSLHLDDVHVGALANELYFMFEPLASEKGVKLTMTVDELEDKIIYTDAEKIKQILKNFLSNAIKFTDTEGTISLTVSSNDDIKLPIKFSIHDTGIGIPEDKILTIFEAFRQVDGSTSRKYGGTGLGLSISKELSTLLGGKIVVESVHNEGSTFSLLLPSQIDTTGIDTQLIDVIKKDGEERQQVISNQLIHRLSDSDDDRLTINKGDKTILIIEDDINFARIVQDEARKLNLKTILSNNGHEGFELAKVYKPSGIILDMNLPVMDGWDVLKLLKADVKTKHIPVKIISADEPNIATKRMGAIDYLQKPVELDELDQALKKLIHVGNKEKKDLLIVEDNNSLRESLIEILNADDINITEASDAKSAVLHVKAKKFDCAIVDIGLPDMDGISLLKILKKHHCELPVIVYSGRDFTAQELSVLRQYSESIVLKTAESEARLVHETALFLHRIESNMSSSQKNLLKTSFFMESSFVDKKVLVVDDDVRNVFSLDALLSDKGMVVKAAYNGREAIDVLMENNNSIDIILMDIMMPIMNGYEAIAEIRKNANYDQIPIIALTAKAQIEDKQKCLDVGANDYMSKPIDNEQLLQLMKLWMNRG